MTELAGAGTVSAAIRLVRFGSVAAAAAICLVGAFLARPVDSGSLALALIAVGSAVATANVFNDLNDLEADSINVPNRPLPSGAMSVRQAWVWFVGLLLTALAAGWLLDPYHGAWVGLMIALSAWYSLHLKRVLILGGLVVAALLAIALVFGASVASGQSTSVHLGSIEIALFTFGRETFKGIRDVEGDRIAGVATIASLWGRRAAILIFVASSYGVAAVAAISGSWLHLVAMALLVSLPGAAIGLWCLGSTDALRLKSAIGRSAWLWVTGLFGIALLGV